MASIIAGALLAGFGRSDITPRPGVGLAGFGPWLNRNSTSVRQPLLARCAVLEQAGKPVILLSLELIGLGRDLQATIRGRIAGECGLDPEAIFIACTHTHSGPQTHDHIGWGHADDLYRETLPGRVIPAVREAIAHKRPMRISYAAHPCEGIAINRDRDTAYDRSMPVEERLDPGWRPPLPGLTDPTCHVVAFHDGDRLGGLIHSFACHPVVCCEQSTPIHGDFPGLASAAMESAHPGSTALFLAGALGDVNPSVSHRSEAESLSALDTISARYAAAVENGLESAKPLDPCVVNSQIRETVCPRVDWSMSDVEARIQSIEERLHASGLTDDPLAGSDDPLERNGTYMVRLASLRRLRERFRSGESLNHPSRLHGIRIGPVRLLGAPFEVFQATRRAVEDALPGGPVIVLSHVNGSQGYAPDPELYQENRYAAEFVTLMAGDLPLACLHEILVRELVGLGNAL